MSVIIFSTGIQICKAKQKEGLLPAADARENRGKPKKLKKENISKTTQQSRKQPPHIETMTPSPPKVTDLQNCNIIRRKEGDGSKLKRKQ
jgi:hypothetical protein